MAHLCRIILVSKEQIFVAFEMELIFPPQLFDLRNLKEEMQTFRGHKKEASAVCSSFFWGGI